jgi:hypothetical protein
MHLHYFGFLNFWCRLLLQIDLKRMFFYLWLLFQKDFEHQFFNLRLLPQIQIQQISLASFPEVLLLSLCFHLTYPHQLVPRLLRGKVWVTQAYAH